MSEGGASMSSRGLWGGEAHRWQAELHDLEMELLSPEARGNPKRMGEILGDDFIEFGSSGRVYHKSMLIEMLTQEEHARVLIRDFAVRELGDEVALVTYRTVGQTGQEARRSSVWVRTGGGWQMVFHQGTRLPNSWGPVR
jgi:hypothetical protein